jgi:ribose transport system substrate-binding protein
MTRPAHRRQAVAAALSSVLLGLCAACGTSGAASTGTGAKKLVYIFGEKDPLYTEVNCGAESAAKAAGFDYSYQIPSTFAPSAQIPVLRAVIATKPAAILISVTSTTAITPYLKQAASQGIKVITVSNTTSSTSYLTSQVIGDSYRNGEISADLLAKGAAGRTGDVAFLGYQYGGSAITDARQNGFEHEISKYKNLHFIGVRLVNGGFSTGAAVVSGLFAQYPHLLGAVGVDLYASVPLAEAVKARGLEKSFVAVSSDSDQQDIADLKAGMLYASVGDQFRLEGRLAVQQAKNALDGKHVSRLVTTPPVVFTHQNVNDPSMQKYIYSLTCS